MSSKKNKKQLTPAPKPIINTSVNSNDDLSPADGKSFPELKEETLRWMLSILGAILIYCIAATIIQSVYHPDLQVLLDLANKFSFAGDARPEPMEALLFRSGVVIITLSTLLFYFFLSKIKWVKKIAGTQFFLLFATLLIASLIALIYVDFTAQNPFGPGSGELPQNARDIATKTNFDFFFDSIFLGEHLLLYTFFIFPLVACIFYFGIKKFNWENKPLFNKVIQVTGYIVAGGIIIAIVGMNSYGFPYTFENKYDFNSVYYSMTQVFAGVPILVDGFSNTYGLYPHFLNPLFHLIGLNVLKFSCVMAFLAGVAFLFNFLTLRSLVRNKIILILGFCSVVFFPYLDFKLLTSFDSSFAFFPIRYIIPSSLLLLTTLYVKKPSQLVYWIIFVLMGFFVLWNPEIGMVSYISWVVFNLYNDFYTQQGKVDVKKILFHLLAGIVTIVVVVLIFKCVFYLAYGTMPDIGMLFALVTAFGKVGFGLLPMRLVHPWNLEAIVIILGFTYSIVAWCKKEKSTKASVIFLVSLISLGFMVYFQGRSHNWAFSASSGFCLILLAILGDELWDKIKDNNFYPLHLLFIIFLFIISFSFFEVLFNVPKINEMVYQDDDKEKQVQEQERITSNADFIIKNTREKEKIFILTAKQYQGLYFDGNKRQSAFNPGEQDMFLNTDLAKMEKRITDSSFSIFLEPAFCNFFYMNRLLAGVGATYEVTDTNKTMALLHKRKTKILSKAFFEHANNLIHRKYSDDTAGVELRIHDAIGMNPVSLNNEFSVEVLFYSEQQLYQYATLIGNMNDSSGFVIAKILKTANYFFGINGKGISLPIPNSQWVYCVMNVFPDHIEVYENGILAGTLPLNTPIRQSREKLFIGNGGFMRYYIGPISEIAVNSKALDSKQIQSGWEEIMQSISGK